MQNPKLQEEAWNVGSKYGGTMFDQQAAAIVYAVAQLLRAVRDKTVL